MSVQPARTPPTPPPTHPATLAKIPTVIRLVGALVTSPNTLPRHLEQVAQTIATASVADRWHLLDATVVVAQTLRDTYTEMTGGATIRFDALELSGMGLPDETVAGARLAAHMVSSPSGLRPKDAAKYRTGQAEGTEMVGAVLMAALCSVEAIHKIASLAGMPPNTAWQKIKPLLKP